MAEFKKVNDDLDGLLSTLKERASAINGDEPRPKKRRRLNEEQKEPEDEAEPIVVSERLWQEPVEESRPIIDLTEAESVEPEPSETEPEPAAPVFVPELNPSRLAAPIPRRLINSRSFRSKERLWKLLTDNKNVERTNRSIASQIRCFEKVLEFDEYPWAAVILRDIKRELEVRAGGNIISDRVRVCQRIGQGPSGNTFFAHYLDNKYKYVYSVGSSRTLAWWRGYFQDPKAPIPRVLVLDMLFCPQKWNWSVISDISNGFIPLTKGRRFEFTAPKIIIFTPETADLSKVQFANGIHQNFIVKKENKWVLE